jgi:hypothetical protein
MSVVFTVARLIYDSAHAIDDLTCRDLAFDNPRRIAVYSHVPPVHDTGIVFKDATCS